MPIKYGTLEFPPPAGSKPTLDSGNPNLILTLFNTIRWWQARHSSKPPPIAVPLIAATKGLPEVSIALNA